MTKNDNWHTDLTFAKQFIRSFGRFVQKDILEGYKKCIVGLVKAVQ